VLVGNLWLQLIEKIPNPTTEPEQHAYVTNFYVTEAARGQGIGTMLLSAALRRLRDARRTRGATVAYGAEPQPLHASRLCRARGFT
jgi:ribosomal protein S18 acetylase RimI-like enzyme